MATIISKAQFLQTKPPRLPSRFKSNIDLSQKMRVVEQTEGRTVVEFVGTDNFGRAWYERQRYEIDRGRDLEPLLYQPIYFEINDPNLPEIIPVNRIGPAAVVFSEITEGGEVKFATVGQSNFSVSIKQFGVGIEYSKKLTMFNQGWSLGLVESQAGIAHNALLNHLHFYPIISYSYTSANQTAASSSGSSLVEKYLRTLEDAVTAAQEDTTNPRRGPYVLLVAPAQRFLAERALNPVPQQGFTLQSSVQSDIASVVVYNGWTGMQGKVSTTYNPVPSGKAYLIDTGLRERNFQSYIKQELQSNSGNPDLSRFILEQTVWDTWRGVYADVAAAVEEITWPVS